MKLITFAGLATLVITGQGCADNDSHQFTLLSGSRTGIHFKNIVKESGAANVLNYAYFYNGGGVAIGDINNDGLPDILFTGNMVANRLYLNKGNFKFEDITEKSGIAKMQGWCTGAVMADVNGDGKPDIYICRSADINPEKRKNLLFINNGDLSFTEKAEEYGLADQGYSTQAAFFDYDKDGDLDLILINHSLQQYARGAFENTALRRETNPAFATKLYRNDNGHFSDVSSKAGISSNVLSFGLGLAVSDINNDGWPDVYISNDFNEPDYLFINNKDGSFSEKLSECMDEVSLFSMGSDCADYNNDGYTDLVTLDMLDEDNHNQKMHSGAENFNKFQMLFQKGFYYQYSRNMLHKNNGDGTFSEIGQLAGVSNTGWSWASLFADFDNDGYKDLFITNGYKKDFTDMDFIKYSIIHQHSGSNPEELQLDLLNKMHPLILPHYIFQNKGGNTFVKKARDWGFDLSSISAGAAYADLDNDGSLDLVVNNMDEEAGIYKNNARRYEVGNNYLKIKLEGNNQNTSGIGTKIKVYCAGNLYYQEEQPSRGFQSSVDPVLNFGIGDHTAIDSIIVIWPDDRMQKLQSVKPNQLLTIKIGEANGVWKYDSAKTGKKYFSPAPAIPFTHKENGYNDFAQQKLLPAYLSRQGPCLARADVNHDGREDLFIGGAKGQPSQLFIQTADGNFIQKPEPAVARDSACETVVALFFDADGDGDMDLYAGSGGYEFAQQDPALQDRLYLNDGKGNFTKPEKALPDLSFSKGCIKAADINGDGAPDLFVGGRLVPGQYPQTPPSKILINNGRGIFTDMTDSIAPALKNTGMVTDAVWADLDNDHKPDLIVVGEWMPVKIFMNRQGKLVDASSSYIHFPSAGWWNSICAADFDKDGDTDLVIGNTGLNTQFKTSDKEPMTLYYKDFDGNGIIDPILCYYIQGASYPAASRDDLMDQIPSLKKKFLEYHAYADATIHDIFSPDQLKDAGVLKAETMETVYLENRGKEGFVLKHLPMEAQYAPVYAIAAADINHDGNTDLILGGNNSWTRIKFGRYRANHGMVLTGDGKGNFSYLPQVQSGLNIRADIRSLQIIPAKGKQMLIAGANDAPVISYVNE